MTFVRLLSKFVLELFPLVLATVISAVLVSTLHLTNDSAQARRGVTDGSTDSVVYVNAMPRINHDAASTVVASLPPSSDVPAPAPVTSSAPQPAPAADATAPVKAAPHPQSTMAPAGRERAARGTASTRANATVSPKAEPVVKIEHASAKVEPTIASVQSAPTQAPPMPIPPMQIVSAELQTAAPEPTRVFGMTVPPSVVSVAKFPIEVAEIAVPSPVVRVGLHIVEKVAGAAGSAISDFGR